MFIFTASQNAAIAACVAKLATLQDAPPFTCYVFGASKPIRALKAKYYSISYIKFGDGLGEITSLIKNMFEVDSDIFVACTAS